MTEPAKQHLNQTERELDAALQRIGEKYNWNLQAFFEDYQKDLDWLRCRDLEDRPR